MELLQALVKGSYPAQDSCRQQIGLGVKGPALEPLVLALGDEPLHVLVDQLQIPQRRALKIAAAVRILRRLTLGMPCTSRSLPLPPYSAKGV
jgi:hypothetical protein